MTQHRANKDIKHGSGVGATSANGNGPAVLLPPPRPLHQSNIIPTAAMHTRLPRWVKQRSGGPATRSPLLL
jgi:hypothetical protein